MTDISTGRVGAAGPARPVRSALEEERDFFLRSLRDLEAERAAGDIDEVDYAALHNDYTTRAAAVLRQLEALDSPALPSPPPPADPTERTGDAGAGTASDKSRWRRRRRSLAVAGVAVAVAAGLGWAIVAATGTRLPGEVASGQAVGQEQVAKLLLAAQQATAKGDGVSALKDLEAVLKQDPNQVVALSSEGWILAQTQQPQLLAQGIGLLSRAVTLDPTYPPTRVYRGVAYLSEGDYQGAVTDLQWYLAHNPDPALVARVRQALVQAQAGAAAAEAPTTTAPPAGAPAAAPKA